MVECCELFKTSQNSNFLVMRFSLFIVSMKRFHLIDFLFEPIAIHEVFENTSFLLVNAFCISHFMPLTSFDTPWKHQKTSGFLMFSGGIKRDQWHEMGYALNWYSAMLHQSNVQLMFKVNNSDTRTMSMKWFCCFNC